MDLIGAHPGDHGGSSSSSSAAVEKHRGDPHLGALVNRIRRHIDDYLGPGVNSVRRLKDVFDRADRNGDRRIDRRELRDCLKEFRLDLHVDDIEMLFEKFDVDRSGSMDYKVSTIHGQWTEGRVRQGRVGKVG